MLVTTLTTSSLYLDAFSAAVHRHLWPKAKQPPVSGCHMCCGSLWSIGTYSCHSKTADVLCVPATFAGPNIPMGVAGKWRRPILCPAGQF